MGKGSAAGGSGPGGGSGTGTGPVGGRQWDRDTRTATGQQHETRPARETEVLLHGPDKVLVSGSSSSSSGAMLLLLRRTSFCPLFDLNKPDEAHAMHCDVDGTIVLVLPFCIHGHPAFMHTCIFVAHATSRTLCPSRLPLQF